MFYLKYRPTKLAELDNLKVKEKITNILSSGNLPHALLFIGPKGTGKTSAARIFAKSVNCLKNKFANKGTNIEPCGKCKSCQAIDQSASPDVLELDAASNRGIDEIKNIIYNSSFIPMIGKYRVFIIDEAHMITPAAFNALLKTLEEPPESVIFILATTNPEKLPKTIISRCVTVNFGRAKQKDIVSMLSRISQAEKLNLNNEFMQLIAKHSDFSFRDAAKILEELKMQNALSIEKATQLLETKQKESFLEVIQSEEVKKVLNWINKFINNGGDVKSLITITLEQLREILLVKKGVIEESDLKNTQLTTHQVVKLMKLLTEAYEMLRISPVESLPLEISMVEFFELNK